MGSPSAGHARVVRLEHTDSTNLEARRLHERGERGPLWVVAGRQSAGRGRLERTWESGAGNLFASALVPPPQRGRPSALAFASALAAREAVGEHASGDVRVKWPNDVLLDGRKVSGILLENLGDAVVAGIGINIAHHPASTRWPATHIGEGATVDAVFTTLIERFAHWRAVLDAEGFAPLRAEWTEHAYGLGQAVSAQVGSRRVVGTARGLGAGGELLVATPSATVEVSAGDVEWPRAKEG